MAGDVSRFMEAQITAVDTATAGAGPATEAQITVPAGCHYIDRIVASSSSDGAALGSCVIGVELTGSGSEDGVQRLIIGGGGAEVTNAGHFGSRAIEYGPMGIKVRPGNPITVNYWMLGEDAGTTYGGISFVFSSGSRGPRLLWESQEVQTTAIDTDIQFQNWAGGAAATMPVPVQSKKLAYMLVGIGGDQAALGSGGAVGIGRGNGLVNSQEVALGGNGGELTTGAGFWANAGWVNCNFEVRGGDSISWYGRMTGEDVGTQSLGIACAFVIG